MLPRVQPRRLRLIQEPFDDPDCIFELKHDGFRAIVYIENGECRLVSRNLKHLKFDSLKTVLSKLPVKNAIFDGEIVCIDEHGVSQFNKLLRRGADPIFYAFDLLWLNDKDLRRLPLLDRKLKLQGLIKSGWPIIYAQHIVGCGKAFFEEICARDLEGIVAKRKHGVYKDSARSWLKIKNKNYSQAEGRHELLTRRK